MTQKNWNNDKLQFARLLCEINANVMGTEKEWDALYESMDLTQDEVKDILDRADDFCEYEKGRLLL